MRPEELLRRLVEIASPTGQEADAVRFLQEQAEADGFRVGRDDEGNFIVDAGSGRPYVLFVGHIDTVPGHIPVEVRDGKLWGRGSVDAKGSLVAFYCAARDFLDRTDLRIRVVGAVDEEGLSRGAKALPTRPVPDALIIGEPSGWDAITLGYKGVVRGRFSLRREHVHGSHPTMSAPDDAVAFWTALRELVGAGTRFDGIQARLESLTTESDGLTEGVDGRFNLRVPWGASAQDVADRLVALGRERNVQLQVREVVEAAQSGRANRLVHSYQEAIRREGTSPRFKRKSGTSDLNTLRPRFPSTPVLAYGPGDSMLDHTPHEHVSLDDLSRAVRVHRVALEQFAREWQREDAARPRKTRSPATFEVPRPKSPI